jgi:hypothetical protein
MVARGWDGKGREGIGCDGGSHKLQRCASVDSLPPDRTHLLMFHHHPPKYVQHQETNIQHQVCVGEGRRWRSHIQSITMSMSKFILFRYLVLPTAALASSKPAILADALAHTAGKLAHKVPLDRTQIPHTQVPLMCYLHL